MSPALQLCKDRKTKILPPAFNWDLLQGNGVMSDANTSPRLVYSLILLCVRVIGEVSIWMCVAYITISGPDEEQSGFVAFAMGVEPARMWKNDSAQRDNSTQPPIYRTSN